MMVNPRRLSALYVAYLRDLNIATMHGLRADWPGANNVASPHQRQKEKMSWADGSRTKEPRNKTPCIFARVNKSHHIFSLSHLINFHRILMTDNEWLPVRLCSFYMICT